MSWNADKTLRCDMKHDCTAPVTHINEKGYVYCKPHGIERKESKRCRQLKPAEVKTLLRGEPLPRY